MLFRSPWPELGQLAQLCREAGYELRERLTIYPEYVHRDAWVDPALRTRIRDRCDLHGYPVAA